MTEVAIWDWRKLWLDLKVVFGGPDIHLMSWTGFIAVKLVQRGKSPAVNPRAPLISVPIGAPMEMLAMDILGPLPESNKGNRCRLWLII